MRRIIAAAVIAAAACSAAFSASAATAEFSDWTDSMIINPGTLTQSLANVSDDVISASIVVDGVRYDSISDDYDYEMPDIQDGLHSAYILLADNKGRLSESSHISFSASSASKLYENMCDFDNDTGWTYAGAASASDKRKCGINEADAAHANAMRIKATGQKAMFLAKAADSSYTEDSDVTIEAEVMLTNINAKVELFKMYSGTDIAQATLPEFTPAVIENGKIGDIEINANEWINLKYDFNMKENRYRLWVNGKAAAEGTFGENQKYGTIEFDVTGTGTGFVWFDNIYTLYYGNSQPRIVSADFYADNSEAINDYCHIPASAKRLAVEFSEKAVYSDAKLYRNNLPVYGYDYSYTAGKASIIMPNGFAPGKYKAVFADGKYQINFAVEDDAPWALYCLDNSMCDDVSGKRGFIPAVMLNKDAMAVIGIYDGENALSKVKYIDGSAVDLAPGEYTKIFVWDIKNEQKPLADTKNSLKKSKDKINASAKENFLQISDKVQETGSTYLKDATGFAEYFSDCILFMGTSKNFWFYGSKLQLKNDPVYKNNKIYLSCEDLSLLTGESFDNGSEYLPAAEYFNECSDMNVSEKEGLLLLAGGDERLDNEQGKALAVYTAMQRPTADLLSANVEQKHPKIYANAAQMQDMFASANTDLTGVMNSAINNADYSIDLRQSGEYETTDMSNPRRLWDYPFVLANYLAWEKTGKSKYKDMGIHIAEYTAGFEHWSQNSSSLVTSSMIITASYAYDLFYDEMTDEERRTIADAIFEKGIEPGYQYLLGNKTSINTWPRRKDNWNVVCASAVAVGAVAIMNDYPEYHDTCASALEAAIRSLEYGMSTFVPGGGGEEGVSYFDYEMYLGLVPLLECLDAAYSTDFGICEVPGFLNSSYFMAHVNGADGRNFLYHDYNVSSYWAQYYELMWFAAKTGDKTLYNIAKNLTSNKIMMYKPIALFKEKTYGEYLDDIIYTGAGVGISSGSNNKLYMHAGKNNATHGQLDMGTFSYDYGGVRFAEDAGGGNYDDGYFTAPDQFYVNRAEAHNVYVINPDTSGGQIRMSESSIVKIDANNDESIYKIDLTAPYADSVYSAVRGFRLSDNREVLTVQDEIVPAYDSNFVWFWNTEASIQIIDSSTVKLTKSGKNLYLHFSSNVDFELEIMDAKPLDASITKGDTLISGLKKVAAKFNAAGGEKVRFTVTADNNASTTAEISDISSWQ